MVYSNYYNWVEIYLENDLLWLDNIVSWEESASLLSSDVFFFDVIFKTSFSSSYNFISSFSYLSFLDIILSLEFLNNEFSLILYKSIILDLYRSFDVYFLKIYYLFYLDYKEYIIFYLYYNPELIKAFLYFYDLYINAYNFNFNVSSLNDTVVNRFDTLFLDFLNYFKWLFLSISALFLIISLVRNSKLDLNIDFYFTRMYIYFYSFSRENRIQFEVVIQLFFFIFFFWIFTLISYNDSQVEFIELVNLLLFYFFLFVIFYLLYKYSLHYFSFLEASVIEGKSASFISKQFVRDISNTFALFLRFFLLLFRLNIYDGLDDILDSYYIFFCDFDDDTYYDELLIMFDDSLFYIPDNNNDANLFNDLESDLFEDLFQKYYVTWGKFFMFWAFILEVAFRISLALYITYLIIFEVHSVNCSYIEDNYIINKRNSFK